MFIPSGATLGDLDAQLALKADTSYVNAQLVLKQNVLVANDAGVKTALNASGTAPIYACRAWVNFNGTGTVAIRAGGNVSSITDNGVGKYVVNFTTAMADVNYIASAFGKRAGGTPYPDSIIGGYCVTASQLAVYTTQGNGDYEDFSDVHVHIVR